MAITLFGFKLGKDDEKSKQETQKTFSLPQNDDGAVTIQTGAYYGTYVDLDGTVRNEIELITRYREMSMQPELETAIDEIVNEAIVMEDSGNSVEINTDDLEQPDAVKQKIQDEFEIILRLLNFGNMGHDIFRRWYIDGRLFYHVVIDESSPGKGIQELRYIDPRRIRKIREIQKTRDPKTGMDVIKKENEYYLYNEKGVVGNHANLGAKIAVDSIVNVNSGLMDAKRSMVLSYLHKCIASNERVRTTSGWKFIKDIQQNDEIYCHNIDTNEVEKTRVKNIWSNGTQNILSVVSRHSSLKCTGNHRVLVKDKKTGKVDYVLAENLIPKRHQICLPRTDIGEDIPFPKLKRKIVCKVTNPEVFIEENISGKKSLIYSIADSLGEKRTRIYSFVYGYQPIEKEIAESVLQKLPVKLELNEKYYGHHTNEMFLPEYINEEFAKLFGFLLGDGWVNTHTIGFSEGVYPELNEEYQNLMIKFFGNSNRIHSKQRISQYGSYYTNNTLGCELLKEMGFISGARNKRIPNWVFESKPEIKMAFIQGLHDADGCDRTEKFNNKWASTFNLANENLIYDIKELWTTMGYCSGKVLKVKQKETSILGNEVKNFGGAWSITICKKLLPLYENIIRINSEEPDEVFDLEVESENHNFIVNGISVHNSIKPLNQLRMIEDASVIYRLSRAPERRIFYVDVGNMSTQKAEQYLRDIMVKYRNKLVYDSNTGEIKDDRKHLSMLEDFWLPRREGSRGTEITTLQGGQNLGEMEDVKYFENKLYKSLGVPISRLEPQQGFSLGRTTEITREELKFNKFVQRLRNKFASMFDDLLRVQLVLKNICSKEEWDEFREKIWYDFKKDNNFSELKEAELLTNRLSVLQVIDPYVGKYYSMEWVRKNVLMLNDEEIEEINQQIQQDMENAPPPVDEQGNPIPGQQPGQVANQVSGQVPGEEEEEPLPPKFQVQPNEVEFI